MFLCDSLGGLNHIWWVSAKGVFWEILKGLYLRDSYDHEGHESYKIGARLEKPVTKGCTEKINNKRKEVKKIWLDKLDMTDTIWLWYDI